MALKRMSIYAIAALLALAAVWAGLGAFQASANANRWTDSVNADITWYDPTYPSYTIDTPQKLAGVAKMVNENVGPNGEVINGFEDKILEVSQDLDLSGLLWVPIGTEARPFKGALIAASGFKRHLSGMEFVTDAPYTGFIGYMEGATVGGFELSPAIGKSLELTSVAYDVYAGAAVGKMVNNISISTLYDITNNIPVSVSSTAGASRVGGIVGQGEGVISNVVNSHGSSVTVSGGDIYTGGVTGSVYGTGLSFKKIWNYGAVSAESVSGGDVHAGGIVGYSGAASKLLLRGEVAATMEDGEDTIILNTEPVSVKNGRHSYAGGIVGKSEGISTWSADTTNSGAVTIDSASGASSSAGGLAGWVATTQMNIAFSGTGAVTNRGGANVHTGAIAGYVNGNLTWDKDFSSSLGVTVVGKSNVYSGGLLGYVSGDVRFLGTAANSGAVRVSGWENNPKPNEVYTGGLIGAAGGRVLFDSTANDAYANSGEITVSAGTGAYTGGIISNRAYARTSGQASNNVRSEADIIVNGQSKLYTGGFIGMVRDGLDKNVNGATFANTITVTTAAADAANTISTGGIVGYYADAAGTGTISGSSFQRKPGAMVGGVQNYSGGILTSTGGGAHTYTGGIVGTMDGGIISGSSAGNTADSYAVINADGVIGGIAGAARGTIQSPTVKYLQATVQTADGFASGVAGIAQGSITGATVGDKDATGSNSVILAAAAGLDRLTAGGIVGRNEGTLAVTNSAVSRIALMNEAGRESYTLGGIAGSLSPAASIGMADKAVTVDQVIFNLNADRSRVGGAIGVNRSASVYAHVTNAEFNIPAANIQAGGIAGVQDAAVGQDAEENFAVVARDIEVTAQGGFLQFGGLFGANSQGTPTGLSERVTVNSAGQQARLGGIAGYNTGSVYNVQAKHNHIAASGERAEAGGIVGRSEGADQGDGKAVVYRATVIGGEELLVNSTATDARIGGIVGYAVRTLISTSKITSELPDYASITVTSSGAMVGGIAGKIEDSHILGGVWTFEQDDLNANNVMILGAQTSVQSYFGGIAGHSDKTRIEKVASGSVTLIVNGANATVGGMSGYNLSSDTGIIVNNHTEALSIRVNEPASPSIVGGIAGLNEARGADPDSQPDKSVSTIQNNRIFGTVRVDAPSSFTGGMVGENRSLIANGSISDKIAVISRGASGTVGGLVGLNTGTGTIYYSYSNANLTIEGLNTLAGGLVGDNLGRVLASYVDIDVTGSAYGTAGSPVYLGGLVGRNSNTIDKSYSVSKVTANGEYTRVGGLVGHHIAGSITNSYAAKEVVANAANSYSGGLLGQITNGTVTTTYSAGQVSAVNGSLAGGFVGFYGTTNRELLYKSYYVKDVGNDINADLSDFAAGDVLWLNIQARLSTILAATLKNREYFPGLSEWNFDTTWRYGSLDAQYKYPELIRSANTGGEPGNGGDVNANINWYIRDRGALTFELKSEAELAGLAAIVNGSIPGLPPFSFEGRTLTVVSPIHIQSKQWVPIGINEDRPFEGTFDGDNLLIDGLTSVSDAQYPYAGLFGVIGQSATVKKVNLEPLSVAGLQHVGVLAGFNKGNISQISIKLLNGVKVSGQTAGSLAGKNSGTIGQISVVLEQGSRVEAVGEQAIAGGLIGDNTTAFDPSLFLFRSVDGSIGSSAANATVGGLIGRQTGDVSGLRADIASSYRISASGAGSVVGGLIGRHVSGKAENIAITFQDGTLQASGADSTLGGVVGQSDAGSKLVDVTVSASGNALAPHMTGNGTVGGIVGAKTGLGSNTFDMEQVKVEGVAISTAAGSSHAVLGGIAGKLTHAAVRQAEASGGNLLAEGSRVTAGGIAGQADNSILYVVKATTPVRTFSQAGASAVGGIAGAISSDNVDLGFDFELNAPLYRGIYYAVAANGSVHASATGNAADVAVGGIVGSNTAASIYHSSSENDLSVSGARKVVAGGIAGFSNGVIVSTIARNHIAADSGTVYDVGGAVGLAAGGSVHYTRALSTEGEKISVGNAVTRPGLIPAAHVGGFVGSADNTKFTDSYADIDVQVASNHQDSTLYGGGFAGLLGGVDPVGSGSMQRVYASGNVDVQGITGAYAGGFAGSVDHYAITGAYATGDVANTGFDTRSGGFAGYIDRDASVKQVYAVQSLVETTGTNYSSRSYTGGFAGYNDGVIEAAYTGTAAVRMDVSEANAFGGAMIGYNFRNGQVEDSFYLVAGGLNAVGRNLGSADIKKAAEDRSAGYGFGSWDMEADASFLTRYGDAEAVIRSAAQLRAAVKLNNADTGLAYYRLFNRAATDRAGLSKLSLAADISLAGYEWIPFDVFSGEFDGQGHTITGLKGSSPGAAAYGFVADNSGKIVNIDFVDGDVAAGANTGLVAGINRAGAVVSGIKLSGTVKVAGGNYTGGVVGANEGTVTDVTVETLTVSGGDNTGGLAVANEGTVSDVTVEALTVNGGGNTGGVVGANEGTVGDVILETLTVNGDANTGGVVGVNEGTVSDVTLEALTVNGGANTGGIVGANEGTVTAATVETLTVIGGSNTGGVAGTNEDTVADVTVESLTVSGGANTGGAIGVNEGTASDVILESLTLRGGNYTGGLIGLNKGTAEDMSVKAEIVATGHKAGGVAGANEGTLNRVYTRGSLRNEAPGQGMVAGGIAGELAASGTIRESFSYMDIAIGAENAAAGGIAGVSRGGIVHTFNSGRIAVSGTEKAWVGGIVGHAMAGTISDSLNYGQVAAVVDGKIVPGQTFFGGIAGQKEAAATLVRTAFNMQMLKTNTAYYDATGKRRSGTAGQAVGLSAGELAWGTLPINLSDTVWSAAAGYYPQLVAFNGTAASKLGAVALRFGVKDTVHRVRDEFGLTRDSELAWTADAREIAIISTPGAVKGSLKTAGSALLTATVQGESRKLLLNEPAAPFADTAAKPKVVAGAATTTFNDRVTVELGTDEADGIIYYTLDGTQPDEWSTVYTGPIVLTATTTIKAVTIAEDKEVSEVLSAVWSKMSFGGVFIPPPAKPAIEAAIGEKAIDTEGNSPVVVPRNSILTLSAPQGQTIYYTTDGSVPTKDSPRYTGDLVLTSNTTIKMITDKDERVVTIEYRVQNAPFELKPDAKQIRYAAGYANNTFKPDQAVSRYEIMEMLAPLIDREEWAMANLLDGVDAGKESLVAFFASSGIMEGYPDNTFGGNRGLTRGEFVAILSRVLKMKTPSASAPAFPDLADHWAARYVNAFTKAGYVDGFPDGTFKPESEITRAQAVALINRIVGKAKLEAQQAFEDLEPAHWAYQDIMAAVQED